jgi:hypothetical protein
LSNEQANKEAYQRIYVLKESQSSGAERWQLTTR